MRWLWLLAITIVMETCGVGELKVKVQGTLRGYFLTPEGKLVYRAIPLASEKAVEPPQESLHLLWAGYYFEGLLESYEPIIGVRIFLGDVLIYPRRFPKPVTKIALPDWKIPLRVHPRYGFPISVEVGGQRGRKTRLTLQAVGVKVLPLLPLKVDWMDFERIKLVLQFLRREGHQLIPGWQAKRITFVLHGEDDQIVWIDPYKPPKGAKRYLGPCPMRGRIYYGVRRQKPLVPAEGGVSEAWTVYLSYRPNWYALPDILKDDPLAEELDNLLRLEVIFHEVIHAFILGRHKRDIVLHTDIEEWQRWWGDAVAQALYDAACETMQTLYDVLSTGFFQQQQVTDWLKTFLAIRWRLKQTHPKVFQVIAMTELVEGIALCLQRLMLAKFLIAPEGQRLQEIDPLLNTEGVDENFASSLMAVQSKMAQCGAHALKVAQKLGVDWQGLFAHRLPSCVDDLLSQLVVWQNEEEKLKLSERVAQERAVSFALQGGFDERSWPVISPLRLYKPTLQGEFEEKGWQLFRRYMKGELVKLHVRVEYLASGRFPSALRAQWQWMPKINLTFNPAPRFSIQRPLITSDHMLTHYPADFCVFLQPTEVLLLRWHGSDLEIKGQGVRIYVPNARVLVTKQSVWLLGSVAYLRASEVMKRTKEVSEMRRGVWFVLPLAWLLAAPAAGQYMIDQTFTCTASGLFHDVLTGQQQYLTLDLVNEQNNPSGDWHCIAGETYQVTASWTSPRAELAELTLRGPDGTVLAQATADPPSNSLSVSGLIQPTQSCTINATLFGKVELKGDVKGEITAGVQICLNPSQQGTITVVVQDETTGKPINPPYRVIVQKKPNGTPRFGVTDSSGVITFSNLDPGNYIVTLEGIQNMPACRWTSEWTLKKRGFLVIRAALAYHRPIEGKIRFIGGGGFSSITVKAVKGSTVKYGEVNLTPDSNGYYHFQIPKPGEGGIPEDGVWTVIVEVTYPNGTITTSSKSVTVPRHCPNIIGIQPPYGSHAPVDAGVFEIQLSPPGGVLPEG